MLDGIHPGLSREVYDEEDRVSFSILKPLRKSPAHCLAALAGKTSEALSLGIAAHMAVLEPEKFAQAAIWRGAVRRGKEWQSFLEENVGRTIFTLDEQIVARNIAKRIHGTPMAAKYLVGGQSELTVFATLDGIPVKARLDYRGPNGIVEFKSTADASPDGFGAQVAKLDYLGQCAFYCDVIEAVTGAPDSIVFIAAEKESPFAVQPYTVPSDLLRLGRGLYRNLLHRWADCRERDEWPGYSTSVLELSIPNWAHQRLYDEFNEAA